MRLTYNLLWLEDDIDWLEATRELIEGELDDLGFALKPTIYKDGKFIEERFKNNGFAEFDLILIDYNLENTEKGDIIIKKIRENEIYTDVLFYSQDVESIKNRFSELSLEGVYSASREDFVDKFNVVMRTTIKKVQEVNTMRGLIMAETSDMDVLMLDNIKMFITNNIEDRDKLKKYIFKKVLESIKGNNNQAEKIINSDLLEELYKKPFFTSTHKAKAINKLIGLINNAVLKDFELFYEEYKQKVLDIRNHFAHVTVISENGEQKLKSVHTGKEEIFNDERCIEIRKDLKEQHDRLKTIKDEIESLSDS